MTTRTARRGNQTGTVLEIDPTDPQGIAWPGHLLVRWADGTLDVVDAEDLDPDH